MPLNTPVIFQIFSKSGNSIALAQCDYNELESVEPRIKEACVKKNLTYKMTVPHTTYSLLKFLETANA
jgi:hypothetical protein